MPGDRNLLSLDASLAIPTRVLRFEVSRLRHRTPVKLVLLTGQIDTHWSDQSGATASSSSVLRSWLCESIKEPSGFLVNYRKPRVSYGPPWAHYLGGYQDRLLGRPLGLPGLRYTAPEGVEHKDYTGVVLG
jgi:hypothetical protein